MARIAPDAVVKDLAFIGQVGSEVRQPSQWLEVSVGRQSYRLSLEPAHPLLVGLGSLIRRYDPDLLLTAWGDTWLLPHLLEQAEKLGISLPLNRDERQCVIHRKERSYQAYGHVIYRGRQVQLFGRWHIDIFNAMMFHDYGMEGILESARVTALPVQQAARLSPGTGISSMQIVTALRQGVLVPWHKQYLYGDERGKPLSLYKILTKLNNLAIPTRGDKEQHVAKRRPVGIWSDAMVRHILKNETYTGIWYYGKTKMVSDGKEHTRQQKAKSGFGKQVSRPREEWIDVPVPAIISLEDFKSAKEKLMTNLEQAKRNTKGEYLMARRLRCAKCGYTFVGMTRREKHRYYRCNGAWRTPKVCDTPHFRVNDVDEVVWEWLSEMLLNPESLAEGLQGMQEETIRSNKALFERLDIIEKRTAETEKQMEKLLDLYLSDGFPKELLQERKGRLDETLANLRREQTDISAHLQTKVLSDEQIADIEAFCEQIRHGLEIATFEQKRHVIDLLDVRGTLAIENDEKVVYVKCLLGQQLLSVARILPLSSTGVIATTSCASRPTGRSR